MCSVYFLEPNFPLSESTFYTFHVTVSAALLTFCTWNKDLHTTQISKDIYAQQCMNEKSFN